MKRYDKKASDERRSQNLQQRFSTQRVARGQSA